MELWKPISGYEGVYEVSDHGRVHSVERVIENYHDGKPYLQTLKSRMMRLNLNRAGYPQVSLYDSETGAKSYLVHRMVLEAFVGPCPEEHETLHADGNPANGHLDNLSWGTAKDNAADKQRHGTQPQGENNVRAVLTEEDVREIRRLQDDVSQAELARRFGVSPNNVNYIVQRKSWRHLS